MTERQLPAAERRGTPHNAQLVRRELVRQHPELTTPEDGPAQWLLVWDAQVAPPIIRSPARFSLDYLFVDADAVPTLVVATRSTDTRVRREAIGRVLDLAANGAPGWSASQLRTALTATHGNAGQTLAAWRRNTSPDLDDFFARVEENLQRGRLRLVLATDVIPEEVRRVVRFLDEQLDRTRLYALELPQPATTSGDPAIAPRRRRPSVRRTGPSAGPSPDELIGAVSPETHAVLEHVVALAAELDLITEQAPSALLLKTGSRETLAAIYFAWNTIDVPVQRLRDKGWSDQAERIHHALQTTTTKRLPARNPAVPTVDAIAHWNLIREVLTTMANLYSAGGEPRLPGTARLISLDPLGG